MSKGMVHMTFIGVLALSKLYQAIYKSRLIIGRMKLDIPCIMQG
jgi:hypothetical protein